MEILLMVFVSSGCILMALSLPLILGKIGPNPWYGFRVGRTLGDPVAWYAVNTYSAKRFLMLGIINVIAAIALYVVSDIDVATYGYSCGVIALAGIMVVLIQSFGFLRSLKQKD